VSTPSPLDAVPDDVEFWKRAAEHDGVITVGERVRFTSRRRADLTSYFGFAGVDIGSIKTRADYVSARRAAAPYFAEWLMWRASRGTPSAERNRLIEALREELW
jgi:hypothetical protein